MSATLFLSVICAGQTPATITIPVTKTAASDGRQMYTGYCAPCHGVDGRGHGPVAAALTVPPTDLTALSKANHGKFPDAHVFTVLQFGSAMPAHGSAEMPVWGPILGNLERGSAQQRQLRVSNLSRYLKTIQVQ